MKNTTAYLLNWVEGHISRMMTWGGKLRDKIHIRVDCVQLACSN